MNRRMAGRCAVWKSGLLMTGMLVGGACLTSSSAGAGMDDLIVADWLERDRLFTQGGSKYAAVAAPAVTTAQDAAGGCDGVKNGLWGFHVASGETDPWWQVDLGQQQRLDRVVVYNRCDSRESRTANIQVLVAGSDGDPQCKNFVQVYQHDGKSFGGVKGKPLEVRFDDKPVSAQVVRLRIPGKCSFALDEVEVYSADDPNTNIALNKPADQISVSPYSRAGTMGDAEARRMGYNPIVSSKTAVAAKGGCSLPHVRHQIDQARRLAARLQHTADLARLKPLAAELDQLEQRLANLESDEKVSDEARQEIYLDVRRVKRAIAFTNPLLDIDKILFIKRYAAGGPFHMCDQFYGCNAKRGGGLFVLEDPFGPNPKLVDLLKDSVVQGGRLKGQKLTGAFLSPELSFDGKTILFAHSECEAEKTYQWAPEFSYHIFRCNADGSGLVQLTDGPTDDFDPCFLPNGRIAFISERRGGYLRCGRHCPVYTMFSMRPDGSDVICLSFHETHEWHPSVTNDGMIVYSRWDYVDRDTNIAHHIWTCYPDGRDPRSFHGNYPQRRESRPWMEMGIRAIPNSNKFVASTGAHHGHAFGSLVLIDHSLEDDGAMSQLTRLTPEVPFPEAEGRPINKYMCYGTPWPLSEDDYLCAYDAGATNHGIYWIDRYGNKELIYRDPAIPSISPIPLQPRRKPRVIPSQTSQASEDRHKDRPATIAVMNVYDSDFAWPADTEIKALRIIQLLPKSTAPPNQPRIGVANQTNARAVLGTVPVEDDGSAYFEAPVGKAIYFQALDERGLAVQSMRSVTYVHPGEELRCQGCHEQKRDSVRTPNDVPLALQRKPSKIEPGVEGSKPYNYVRLVQPVLDRHCVGCHQEKKALDLTGQPGSNGFTTSYNNLAGKYGFYFHVSNGSINTGVHGGSRTIAGQFGAAAAPLMKYLGPEHHGVQLPDEDFRRITLWLDCNSEFLGAYENAAAQARGELVEPSLE